ncbi:ATP-dependent Clp protease ATP-binding subunit ClpA [Moraxella ovis]|uniref:ATP-dependent Clp protease ATP-binding subunit ClpA n=1 Tax=Moraxella ovis TaxID=29433 RepID=UPI000D8BEDE0|nr:ATP-dependent Clp protease ATP-binding subunit ClpA [Moraxella ovis]SPX84416.1 ATP-dependent Clp protease ATP-binding subunit ClpA [Moraxella ovis]STZ06982.1 ATP-dependent Clp protease ATP-binding subunit ClpA [Moraxella ovis]
MFGSDFEIVRKRIETFTKKNRHEFITVEHLLLGLINDQAIKDMLDDFGVDVNELSDALKIYLSDYVPKTADDNARVKPTKSCERVLQRAIWHHQSSGIERPIDCMDVLVGIFSEKDSQALYLLQAREVSKLRVLRYISHNKKDEVESSQTPSENKEPAKSKNPLEEFATNLNERAKKGRIDPLIGRDAEIERTAQVLCRRRKNNPLLVGEAGVGKTAIAEGLAWLIVNGRAPKPLADTVIYSLEVGSLVAGTKFRGDFENRMKALLEALKEQPNAVLFIDEIHTMIGAGSTMNSSMDMSNLIKPALSNGELRCIGSTTFNEYRQIFERDHALSRRFQKIDVVEPSVTDTVGILEGLKERYEKHHHVQYTDEALEAAAALSARYIQDKLLPDKAIDVMDEAGARTRLVQAAKDDEAATVIDVPAIEEVVAKIARIPPKSVSKDDKDTLKNLERNLKHVIFGQDEAIEALSDAIKLARAGLKPTDKPIGAFMFAGPTGVGKTEVCKQLAFALGVEFVRFDMSEYMEAHTASRLIGSPPGYVGFDQGGLLTEKIHKHPHSVLLLDEIEKAHPDVFNLLLQVMDHGTLTDNNGRSVSFRQVILIMTTNVGAESISRASMGFTHQDHSSDNADALKRTFTPEFRNRLDAIVNFAPLDESVITSVVDKFIIELQAQLDDKNVVIEIDGEARAYLAKKGYDKLMGARPMGRLIQNEIKKVLAEMILFGELVDGGVVQISVDKSMNTKESQADDNQQNLAKLSFNVIQSALQNSPA